MARLCHLITAFLANEQQIPTVGGSLIESQKLHFLPVPQIRVTESPVVTLRAVTLLSSIGVVERHQTCWLWWSR